MTFDTPNIIEKKDSINFEANIRFLNETSVTNRDMKILEIGSGQGRLLNYFYRKRYDIRGVEISETLIDGGRKLYGELPLKLVTSEILPFDNHYFDIIMSFDVFEHIPDTPKHLKEVNRVLKNEGFYLLATPNKWTSMFFEIIRFKSFTKSREFHCSLHNYWEIRKRFAQNGFVIAFYDIPVVNEFFIRKVKLYLGKIGVTLLKNINIDKMPLCLRTNFFIKAEKVKNIKYN